MNSSTTKKIVKKPAAAKKTSPAPKPVPNNFPNHVIGTSQAKAMISRFTDKQKKLNTVYFFSGREYHISLFQKFLKLKGVVSLQFRNAINDKNEHTLVITAADKDGKILYLDMKAENKKGANKMMLTTAAASDPYGVGDMGNSCPEYTGNSKI